MPQNLFAACRVGGNLVAKRVPLDATVQDQVEVIFAQQEQSFFKEVDEEIPFDGRWKPDANELLTLEATEEAETFRETLAGNATAVEAVETGNFAVAGIKALYTGEVTGDAGRVLVQGFTLGQVLSKKFVLYPAGNAFRRFEPEAFSLASKLAFVIEGGQIKFKSYQVLQSVLNVREAYREATEAEVQSFVGHSRLAAPEMEKFLELADQPVRKLVNEVLTLGILDNFTAEQIRDASADTGLEIILEGERVVLPDSRRGLKDVLLFLADSRLSGPLTGNPYVINSKRPA